MYTSWELKHCSINRGVRYSGMYFNEVLPYYMLKAQLNRETKYLRSIFTEKHPNSLSRWQKVRITVLTTAFPCFSKEIATIRIAIFTRIIQLNFIIYYKVRVTSEKNMHSSYFDVYTINLQYMYFKSLELHRYHVRRILFMCKTGVNAIVF